MRFSFPTLGPAWIFLRLLRVGASGVALMEFAFALPIVLTIGLFGIETANLALAHLRMSQIALNLADNVSRVGAQSALSLTKLRESDINDSFDAARLQSDSFDIGTRGRIILSSLERNATGGQWIHWQRCMGARNYTSSYGVAGNGATGNAFLGMGVAGAEIKAPSSNGAVMFVELYYDYKPLVGMAVFGTTVLHYTASFIVRDQRDLVGEGTSPGTGTYNVTASPVARCTLFNS